jgi:hypothetical protein
MTHYRRIVQELAALCLSAEQVHMLKRPGPASPPGDTAERPAAAGLAAAAAWFLAPVPARHRPSSWWHGGGGPSFSRLSP